MIHLRPKREDYEKLKRLIPRSASLKSILLAPTPSTTGICVRPFPSEKKIAFPLPHPLQEKGNRRDREQCLVFIPAARSGASRASLNESSLHRALHSDGESAATMASAGSEEACREIRGACGTPRRLGPLLAPRSPAERQQIRAAYRATFGEDLAATLHGTLMAMSNSNSNQEDEVKTNHHCRGTAGVSAGHSDGRRPSSLSLSRSPRTSARLISSLQLCKLLYLWALEPAERDAVVAREAVEGGVTVAGYRALVEVFTRRKHDQLFFTKQAYMARFRRNLDQDMLTEPSHPYQRARVMRRPSLLCSSLLKPPELNLTDYRHCCLLQQLLLALAASRRSHRVDLSQHVAKCDARRLHDTRNSGAGSVVDEAVILEMFSKRSIPQLRLAFCSYKRIYGHDYTKASGLIQLLRAIQSTSCSPAQ